MERHTWVAVWAATEMLLLIPGLLALLFLPVDWFLSRLRVLPPEAWLNSVLYLAVGALSGAFAGAGVAEAVETDGRAGIASTLISILIVFTLGAGASALVYGERQKRPRPPKDAPATYVQDILDLAHRPSVTILTRREHLAWLQHAEWLHQQGELRVQRSNEYSFSTFWRERRPYTRAIAYLNPAIGTAIALACSLLAHQYFLLIALPAGFSYLLALWVHWKAKRRWLLLDGLDLREASARIEELVRAFEVEPEAPEIRLNLWERLARAFRPFSRTP